MASFQRRVTIELSERTLAALEELRGELGLKTRGELVGKILDEVLFGEVTTPVGVDSEE